MKKQIIIFGILISLLIFLSPLAIGAGSDSPEVRKVSSTPVKVSDRLENSVILYIGSSQALVNNRETQVDPSNSAVKPLIKSQRMLVPLRFVSENLGAKVNWDSGTSTAVIQVKDKKIVFTIGSSIMKVNGFDVTLDAAPQIEAGRTNVPLRKLADALGKKVFYDRGLIILSDIENIYDTGKEKAELDRIIARVNGLPVVGSMESLRALLTKNQPVYNYKIDQNAVVNESSAINSPASSDRVKAMKVAEPGSVNKSKADYSETNLQVEGVDEADVVKTDGKFIYQVNRQRIIILDANSPEKLSVCGTLDFGSTTYNPQEIYIDGDNLLVISQKQSFGYTEESMTRNESFAKKDLNPYHGVGYPENRVIAAVYNAADKKNIKEVRKVEIDGNYVSSRKIGKSLYVVSNKNAGYVYSQDKEIPTPFYLDSAKGNTDIKVECKDIRYFPDTREANYLVIAGFNINENKPAEVSTYLGSGQNIYASGENLYVAIDRYNSPPANTFREDGDSTFRSKKAPFYNYNCTEVFKFSLTNGKATYLNKQKVPGRILNQFSMDENGKYFRIATQTSGYVQDIGYRTSNNVYVLDEVMNITGKLENIAPGEDIKSVRFMGDRGYVVTYIKVDPFFVIDLKEPSNPRILGELKIPGYSDYLQPYDDNHILGFGKDSVEAENTGYYQGMKVALFDVTDVTKPKELYKVVIGDRGTTSELLTNHKALLFDRDKNLLAFPVSVYAIKGKDKNNGADYMQYGQFAYQGAYVYNLSLESGFNLKGVIKHMTDEEAQKMGNYYESQSNKFINRILYIGDTLYTLSNSMVKANSMEDLSEKNTLNIN